MDSYFTLLKDFCVDNKTVVVLSGLGAAALLMRNLRGKRKRLPSYEGLSISLWTMFTKMKPFVFSSCTTKRIAGRDYPADTVILHVNQSKATYVPSLGHFCVKLQTYLNVAKIKYEVCYENIPGPKKKIPWIEYNGMSMGDSQLIINFLNKLFNVDLNNSLSKSQRAEAWAVQKWLEEFTYWLNVYIRWDILLDDQCASDNLNGLSFQKYVLKFLYKRSIRKSMFIIGIGRHTDQEIFDMMTFDLRQLSKLLGDKQYLMGGDSPTEVDCAAFGQLAQIRWATPDSCPGKQLLVGGELDNLVRYTDNIKAKFWPDWDKQIRKTH